jgi:maltooligosyltrehalose trehalohydrolase
VLTSPFVPMLFMGEEWGATTPFQYSTSHTGADLARAVTVVVDFGALDVDVRPD